ncbi:hypothetical protein [Actinotalea sp. K2]|uniref:hypothetical protein n=1 Tax=Actinotalea sp. K2 TaxID=2939438 RepID=UPI0020172A1C|nr:hypothetical protein [Actinotalea sp. K2]MCL3859924.1 hypothetical protein [Actinotalea sp. K2]
MQTGLTLQVAVATALGALAAGAVGGWVAVSTYELGAAMGIRALVAAAVVVVIPYALVRRRVLSARRSSLVLAGVAGLVVGYALNPFSWVGRAFFAQTFVAPGALTAVLDLTGWLALGTVTVLAASRAAPHGDEALGYRQ